MTIGEIQFEQVQPSIGWPLGPQLCVHGVGSEEATCGVGAAGQQSAPEGPEVVNSYPSPQSTTTPPMLTQPFANGVPVSQGVGLLQSHWQFVTEVPAIATCFGVQQGAGGGHWQAPGGGVAVGPLHGFGSFQVLHQPSSLQCA